MQLHSHDGNQQLDDDHVIRLAELKTDDPAPGNGTQLPSWRRRLRLWLAAGMAILLLVFLPPLINANRYQRQIARSMSLSLGRPVHLDNVSFHLLPVPGLTLSNLVVSEDPAFGAEPTIRANTVEASLRLSSLWRRRVEFSTVRFVEPSVNLVRNAEGRWNLADVLLHAAHAKTAPTAQRRAGSSPRFPYIEATDGRVNVKLGDEKLPFSLTAADFALWQPSAHQWRVRLRGQPDRTDVNMTDPGSLRIEGDLLQAAETENVRVDLHAHWYDAPLGEATLLLTGADMGWRGRLNLDASLAGTLEAAQVSSKLTLGGLRRAEFAPAHPLDLQATCSADLSIKTVLLTGLVCSLPDNAPEPLRLTAPQLNLQHPAEIEATISAVAVPNHWALLWAALFSPRISPEADPPGTLDLQFTHQLAHPFPLQPLPPAVSRLPVRAGRSGSGPAIPNSAWNGSVTVHLSGVVAGSPDREAALPPAPESLVFRSVFGGASQSGHAGIADPNAKQLFQLAPTSLHPDPASSLQVDAVISTAGYSFDVAGIADRATLLAPTRFLPELGDDRDALLTAFDEGGDAAAISFSCNATWGTSQVCASSPVSIKGKGRASGGLPGSPPTARSR